MEPVNSPPPALFTDGELFEGQLQTWDLILGFVSTFAVKAACLLRIPDILACHGPLSLQDIASRISSNSLNTDYLSRLLRFLCAKGVFSLSTVHNSDEASEPVYGLTPVSASLLQDQSPISLGPMLIYVSSAEAQLPWERLSDCVLHGGSPFESFHGMNTWSFCNKNPDYNRIVNDAMAHSAPIEMKALLEHYRGFESLKTLVDVGGGVGRNISQIVARYPNIKGVNFDLPHVIATAPSFPGVEQIGGDMFDSIPAAEAMLMKSIMHDWDDEHCIKILKNCRKALPESGKVIIVDSVLDTDEERPNPSNNVRMAIDLLMLVLQSGKERSRQEWVALLEAAGFPRYTIAELPCTQSVIEAYPGASS